MYPAIFVAIAAIGVVFWLLRDKKRAMFLTAETSAALNAARADLAQHDEAARIALAELQKRCDAAIAERDTALEAYATAKTAEATAQAEIKKLNSQLDRLCHEFQIPRKAMYSDQEMLAAARKQRLRRQLGPEVNFILNEAKRRGMIV